jgi:HK97 family phage major capsid protein
MKRNKIEKLSGKLRKLQAARRKAKKVPYDGKSVILGLICMFVMIAFVTLLNPFSGGAITLAAVGLVSFAKADADLNDEEKALLGGVEKRLNEAVDSLKKGLITQSDLDKLTKSIEDQLKAFNEDGQWAKALKDMEEWKESIKEISLTIEKMKAKGGGGFDTKEMKDFVEGILPDLKKWKETGQGAGSCDDMSAYKAVMSVTSNTLYDTVSPSVFAGITDYSRFYERRRPDGAFILNLVRMTRTNSFAFTYTEETGKTGDATVVAEGGLKPNVSYTTEDKLSKAEKIAAHFQITEEMLVDTPRLAARIEKLFNTDVRLAFHKHILTFIITKATGYASTSLDGAITDPSHYDAIGAAIAQMQSLEFIPDTIVLNPQDAMQMKLVKDTSGQYVASPFGDNSLNVLTSNLVSVGHFILVDSTCVNVEIYKDYSLRYGWINDDFIKNQYTAVGEIRAHVYLPDNNKNGLIYSDFLSIETAIEA